MLLRSNGVLNRLSCHSSWEQKEASYISFSQSVHPVMLGSRGGREKHCRKHWWQWAFMLTWQAGIDYIFPTSHWQCSLSTSQLLFLDISPEKKKKAVTVHKVPCKCSADHTGNFLSISILSEVAGLEWCMVSVRIFCQNPGNSKPCHTDPIFIHQKQHWITYMACAEQP